VHTLSSIVIVIVLCGTALACGALYLLPLLIGLARRVPDIGSIAAINVLLGWTLVGWTAALAMALRSSHPAPPAVQVVQHFPHPRPNQEARSGWDGPPGPPPPAAGAGWAQHFGPPASRPGSPPPLVIQHRRPADQENVGHER
jgi:hypothetical protein